jgi:hypothetical protein
MMTQITEIKQKLLEDIAKLLIEYEKQSDEIVGSFVCFEDGVCEQGNITYEFNGEKMEKDNNIIIKVLKNGSK